MYSIPDLICGVTTDTERNKRPRIPKSIFVNKKCFLWQSQFMIYHNELYSFRPHNYIILFLPFCCLLCLLLSFFSLYTFVIILKLFSVSLLQRLIFFLRQRSLFRNSKQWTWRFIEIQIHFTIRDCMLCCTNIFHPITNCTPSVNGCVLLAPNYSQTNTLTNK
jgi:hypothetical protein